jgi:hypothetical protein
MYCMIDRRWKVRLTDNMEKGGHFNRTDRTLGLTENREKRGYVNRTNSGGHWY